MPRTPRSPKSAKRSSSADGAARRAGAPSADEPKKGRAAKLSPAKTDVEPKEHEEGSEEGHDREEEHEDGESTAPPESEPALSLAEPEAEAAEELDAEEEPRPISQSPSSLTRFDPMPAYLREVQRHPLLTPEETHDAGREAS